MHFVIMGSGRVGSAVADFLDKQGHSVAVIDKNPDSFKRLSANFNGKKVKGIGFDRDTLRRAKIDEAYAFAAISNSDNSNILAARIARENFKVKNVVSRIYDPNRADVYRRLGIPTITPVKWACSEMLSFMLPEDTDIVFKDTEYGADLIRVLPMPDWIGVPLPKVQKLLDIKIAYIGRIGEPIFNLSEQVIQENDELFCMVTHERTAEIRKVFTYPPDEDALIDL